MFDLPEGADGRLALPHHVAHRHGQARGVAAAIAYLGSDDAHHVNGSDLRIDGATHS